MVFAMTETMTEATAIALSGAVAALYSWVEL